MAQESGNGDDQPIIMSGGSINIIAGGDHIFLPHGDRQHVIVATSFEAPILSRVVTSIDITTASGTTQCLRVPGGKLHLEVTYTGDDGKNVVYTLDSKRGAGFVISSQPDDIADSLQRNRGFIHQKYGEIKTIALPGRNQLQIKDGSGIFVFHFVGTDPRRPPTRRRKPKPRC